MMLFPTPVSPLPVQVLSDVSAFMVEITAAHVAALTNYHTFFVVASAGCKVFWGDGAESTLSAGTNTCTHTYAGAGQYLIRIRGTHTHFYHGGIATGLKVIKGVKLYSGLISCESTFQGCADPRFSLLDSVMLPPGVNNILGMFRGAYYFNSPCVVHWNTSAVIIMELAFYQSGFNQDISAWNVANTTNIRKILAGAYKFNQNLGGWNVAKITNAEDAFGSTALSSTNYDLILNGWAAQAVKSNVIFGAGTTKYSSAAASARASLVSRGWTITDGGLAV